MHALYLPRLGQTMDSGLLAAWLIGVDEAFEVGTPLYEVETEKITTSVEATLPGRIVRQLVDADSEIAVGAVLAIVADAGETPSPEDIERFLVHGASGGNADAHDVSADPTRGATVASPPDVAEAREGAARAMPRTRALAHELRVDLREISGSGRDGLVIPADVHAAAEAPAPSAAAASAVSSQTLTPVQRRMAATLSAGMVPQFTQMVDADVTSWRQARETLQPSAPVALTFTDFILDAVVRACLDVPQVNATFAGDRIDMLKDIDIALAMDTPDGLLVPVMRRTQELSLLGRARQRHELADRARSGSLTVDDMGTGSITVSNLGAYGVTTGVPLLVSPYTAIIFVGSLEERVVARSGGIAIRTMCGLAISFDHRVVDGATAARFTSRVRAALEQLTGGTDQAEGGTQ